MPKVSIITPSYNQAEYIGRAVDSVLAQRGDFEVEYVVAKGRKQLSLRRLEG